MPESMPFASLTSRFWVSMPVGEWLLLVALGWLLVVGNIVLGVARWRARTAHASMSRSKGGRGVLRISHPFGDGGLTTANGPVPEEIQTATGASTWEGVANWVDQQFDAAGATGNFAGSVRVRVASDTGAVLDGPAVVSERGMPPS